MHQKKKREGGGGRDKPRIVFTGMSSCVFSSGKANFVAYPPTCQLKLMKYKNGMTEKEIPGENTKPPAPKRQLLSFPPLSNSPLSVMVASYERELSSL